MVIDRKGRGTSAPATSTPQPDTFAIICCWRTICMQLTLIKFECNNYIQEEKSHLPKCSSWISNLLPFIWLTLSLSHAHLCIDLSLFILIFDIHWLSLPNCFDNWIEKSEDILQGNKCLWDTNKTKVNSTQQNIVRGKL